MSTKPAQEFGNAFSLFISQNHGAGRDDRVKQGMGSALRVSMGFCLAVSLLIFLSARYLMMISKRRISAMEAFSPPS